MGLERLVRLHRVIVIFVIASGAAEVGYGRRFRLLDGF